MTFPLSYIAFAEYNHWIEIYSIINILIWTKWIDRIDLTASLKDTGQMTKTAVR